MIDKHLLAKLLAAKQHHAAQPPVAPPNIAPVKPLDNTNPIGEAQNSAGMTPVHAIGPIKSVEVHFHQPGMPKAPAQPKMPRLGKMLSPKY